MTLLTPPVLQNVTTGTALAAHWYQRVYALDDGYLKQYGVGNNGTSWPELGNVPTL